MSGRWFRFYDGALDDPKVQALPGDLFKVWVNLLCVASRNDGRLPAESLAFMLRTTEKAMAESLKALQRAGLIDIDGDDPKPHNWDARQFKSDTSNDRVKRHRQRKGNASGNGDVTLQETPPETEADTEQREGAPARMSRLPSDWILPAEGRVHALGQGIPADIVDREESKFRNHYHGNGETRADWLAVWRKWIDTTCEKAGYRPSLVSIVGTIPSIAISTKDPRWKPCADRWEREHGAQPKSVQSGAFPEGSKLFPSDWEETRMHAEAAA